MQAEARLIKLPKLHLESSRPLQNDINAIATNRINQVISKGGKEMERVLPKTLRGAIKDVYQTPFRLLGDFGKQQFNKIKREISNQLIVNHKPN